MRKITAILLAIILLSLPVLSYSDEMTESDKKPEITALNSCIMDYDTGEILYANAEDEHLPVASIAKMMSVYVVMDKIKTGELTLDTVVPISENVYNLSRNEEYKMMAKLEYDETYTLNEMLDMIIIDSAAACVTAVAELVSGNEGEFVNLMNAKAAEIGINSVFHNGTGVCLNPDTDNEENLMSAKEVAVMTRHMIQDYPELLERTKQASVDFHGNVYENLNKLFTTYYYEGADGFKNGMTDASGYCMCGTAERGGKRVITVALRCESNDARFTDTISMFDYAFDKLGIDATQAEDATPRIIVDGNLVTFPDQQPVIIDGRTFVPVRGVLETMNKKVEWDEERQAVIISDELITLELVIGSPTMLNAVTDPVSGEVFKFESELDAPPRIINDRTCLPIRAVAEGFGVKVDWNDENHTVIIDTGASTC